MSEMTRPDPIFERGARPSVIETFGIHGLYGYRSISLSSEYAATILIAKNGTGKTTLLGALDAFLRMQFGRLLNIEFDEIHCKLRFCSEHLVLTHNDVIEFLQGASDPELLKLASRSNVEPSALFNFIIEEWESDFRVNHPDYMDHKVYAALLSSSNYSSIELEKTIDRVKSGLYKRIPSIDPVVEAVGRFSREYEIVYLPTYRRVELALPDEVRQAPYGRRKRPRFAVAAGSLFTGNIQFGLSDISEQLAQLNQRIIIDSNNGYRAISAKIINELIDGSYERELESDVPLPSKDELKLFFSRLEQGRRVGPYMPVVIPDLDGIYGQESAPDSSSKFLNYFLKKLATVMQASKAVEQPVDAFIDSCNKYLLLDEPSTILGIERSQKPDASIDAKELSLNRSTLEVQVSSVPEGRSMSLDALSSGEKQMISLFAKLFLYPGKKVVLIDEPELSLSIDWQAHILVDVLRASLCEQVIAITHSPFVFDNELEKFAKPLQTKMEGSLKIADSGELL